ncbi:hypothetical protein B0H14DRAFT_3434402 [Mycena olivaceomarginata]|nr:hypothetical protein B0H14DRAFT_3434402 [Mycena olivaceomarginata]
MIVHSLGPDLAMLRTLYSRTAAAPPLRYMRQGQQHFDPVRLYRPHRAIRALRQRHRTRLPLCHGRPPEPSSASAALIRTMTLTSLGIRINPARAPRTLDDDTDGESTLRSCASISRTQAGNVGWKGNEWRAQRARGAGCGQEREDPSRMPWRLCVRHFTISVRVPLSFPPPDADYAFLPPADLQLRPELERTGPPRRLSLGMNSPARTQGGEEEPRLGEGGGWRAGIHSVVFAREFHPQMVGPVACASRSVARAREIEGKEWGDLDADMDISGEDAALRSPRTDIFGLGFPSSGVSTSSTRPPAVFQHSLWPSTQTQKESVAKWETRECVWTLGAMPSRERRRAGDDLRVRIARRISRRALRTILCARSPYLTRILNTSRLRVHRPVTTGSSCALGGSELRLGVQLQAGG